MADKKQLAEKKWNDLSAGQRNAIKVLALAELSHTLDALADSGAGVAVSARVGTGQWQGWPPRLMNRLVGGLAVRVDPPGADGRREIAVHSRSGDDGPWVTHATGVLVPELAQVPGFDFAAWPPPGAEALGTGDLYERLASGGLEYGPGFQGLRGAWRLGQDVYADVALPD